MFTWRVGRRGKARVGSLAGCKDDEGYVYIRVDYRAYRAHRLAWLYMTGTFPVNVIDHIDGNPANNRIENLRDVTNAVNLQNQKRAQIDNKCGLLGVYKHRKRFRARITVDGKITNLGTFDTPELAHAAYLAAKPQIHAPCYFWEHGERTRLTRLAGRIE